MSILKTYSVLNSVAASAADITLNGGVLAVANTENNAFPPMPVDRIYKQTSGATAYVAETLQVQTLTFTAANSTEYSFCLQQDIDGVIKVQKFSYVSDSTGTAAEIAAAILAMVNSSGFKITATGSGSPVTLTAQTGYPVFVCTKIAGFSATATTTAGVYAKYTGDQLLALGITAAQSGTNYAWLTLTYSAPKADTLTLSTAQDIEHTLFIADETDTADFITAMNNLLKGGTAANAATANAEQDGIIP